MQRQQIDYSDVASGLSSLAGLLLFVVGIPMLLTSIQSASFEPLVRKAIAHPDSVIHSLGHPVSNSTILDSVLLLVWLTWTWLVVCLAAELLARLRGRPAARVPASKRVQALAALLVGASIALLPVARGANSMRVSAAGLGSLRLDETALTVNRTVPDLKPPIDVTPKIEVLRNDNLQEHDDLPARSFGGGLYTVRAGDTLWSIAERELGSPFLWKEIAALNIGRQQPDGRCMVEAAWILPGWELELPQPVRDLPKSGSLDLDQTGKGAVTDTMAAVAASEDLPVLEPKRAASPEVVQKIAPTADRDHSASIPLLLRTGRSQSSPPIQFSKGVSIANGSKELKANGEGKQQTTSEGGVDFPIAPFGYGLLGAGVVGLLSRLRKRQQRYRPTGRRIAFPENELATAELALHASADCEGAQWVDATLRTLAGSCRREEIKAPRVMALCILEQAIELVFDPADSIPAISPFLSAQQGTSWVLPRSDDFVREAKADPWISGLEVISPGMVTLGRGLDALLLVDLEQIGSLEVLGEQADDVLRSMAIELATSTWSEQVNVIVIGLEASPDSRGPKEGSLDAIDRIRPATDVVEVLPELRHLTKERALMLNAVGYERNAEARHAVSGDGWDLTVVFCGTQSTLANQKAVAQIVDLSGDGSHGLSLVAAGVHLGARSGLRVGNGPATVELPGRNGEVVWLQTISNPSGGQIAGLVSVANTLEGVDPEPEVADAIGLGEAASFERSAPPTIQILVLGPVEVLGAARPFTRAWSLELVVYLAMHPEGASSDQWATHLWPNRSMAPASLHSTASAARRALGSTATGEDHMPRSHGKLSLGPEVSTDWEQFRTLSARVDPLSWKKALTLVRGRPFDGLRSTDWAVFSHVQANIESLVVDVAARYAENCLEQGDAPGSEWAARQGLLVCPYDERLYRILMKSADLAGNPAGVEGAMRELLQLVGGEVEPYDSVHPETYELYRRLSRRNLDARHR